MQPHLISDPYTIFPPPEVPEKKEMDYYPHFFHFDHFKYGHNSSGADYSLARFSGRLIAIALAQAVKE